MVLLVLGACAESEEPAGPELGLPGHGGVPAQDGAASPSDAGAALEGGFAALDGAAQPPRSDASSTSIADAAGGGGACVASRVSAVRPLTDQCRSCHTQYALAGKSRFVLGTDPAEDEVSFQAAFKALGRDLIAMPAQEATRMHPGGKLLEKGTASYAAWDSLLQALASPTSACVGGS